jgi:zona occludens toxin
MITLITGTPGAGKTLYAVSKLLRDLVGTTVDKSNDDGTVTKITRRILTNINGLLLDHELINADAGGGLADWHLWAKPGDVIVYDEVQKPWPPRANGSKVPDYIQGLETHRHMGVDFILLTQNPMLIDRNVTALVGRHLHVRRFGAMGAAIVYEWDHCSRSLLFSKSIAKAPWKYDKSVYKLYKSAELHTKPKTSIPTLAFVVVGAIAAAAYFIPSAADRIMSHGDKAKIAGKPASSPVTPASASRPAVGASGPVLMVSAKPDKIVHPTLAVGLDRVRLVGMSTFNKVTTYFFQSADGQHVTSFDLVKVGYRFSDPVGCSVKVETDSESRHFLCDPRPFDQPPALPGMTAASSTVQSPSL